MLRKVKNLDIRQSLAFYPESNEAEIISAHINRGIGHVNFDIVNMEIQAYLYSYENPKSIQFVLSDGATQTELVMSDTNVYDFQVLSQDSSVTYNYKIVVTQLDANVLYAEHGLINYIIDNTNNQLYISGTTKHDFLVSNYEIWYGKTKQQTLPILLSEYEMINITDDASIVLVKPETYDSVDSVTLTNETALRVDFLRGTQNVRTYYIIEIDSDIINYKQHPISDKFIYTNFGDVNIVASDIDIIEIYNKVTRDELINYLDVNNIEYYIWNIPTKYIDDITTNKYNLSSITNCWNGFSFTGFTDNDVNELNKTISKMMYDQLMLTNPTKYNLTTKYLNYIYSGFDESVLFCDVVSEENKVGIINSYITQFVTDLKDINFWLENFNLRFFSYFCNMINYAIHTSTYDSYRYVCTTQRLIDGMNLFILLIRYVDEDNTTLSYGGLNYLNAAISFGNNLNDYYVKDDKLTYMSF